MDETVSTPYLAARELLQSAERDAAETRSQADQYLKRREQEAELLVAKARRVLVAAENKAAAIVSHARAEALEMRAAAEAGASEPLSIHEPVSVVDLVAQEVPEVRSTSEWSDERLRSTGSGLDRMLASAISSAMQGAFPGPH